MTLHTHVIPSPLRLNRYFLKALRFKLYDEFSHGLIPEGAEITVPAMDVGATCEHNPDNYRQWKVELNLNLTEPQEGSFPYKVDATLVGYFTVHEKFPDRDVEKLVKTSGTSLLYSTARDMVNAVTGRSSFAPMILPSALFIPEPEPQQKRLTAPKQLKAASKTRRKIARKK
jgi:preprotein translocase subunit SecB